LTGVRQLKGLNVVLTVEIKRAPRDNARLTQPGA